MCYSVLSPFVIFRLFMLFEPFGIFQSFGGNLLRNSDNVIGQVTAKFNVFIQLVAVCLVEMST